MKLQNISVMFYKLDLVKTMCLNEELYIHCSVVVALPGSTFSHISINMVYDKLYKYVTECINTTQYG